eukprot:5275591-Amphidinium_carterae.2
MKFPTLPNLQAPCPFRTTSKYELMFNPSYKYYQHEKGTIHDKIGRLARKTSKPIFDAAPVCSCWYASGCHLSSRSNPLYQCCQGKLVIWEI